MNYLGNLLSSVKGYYNEINSATLTGAIDVVVIEQPDGIYLCSPFHVRFGKLGVLKCKGKAVDIEINGEPVDIQMKLGEAGEAFFVHECDDSQVPDYLATSPLPEEPEPSYHAIKEEQIFQMDDDWDEKTPDGNLPQRSFAASDDEVNLQGASNHSFGVHDYHSDGEITPFQSGKEEHQYGKSWSPDTRSRSPTPGYNSDSEYEKQKHDASSQSDTLEKWQWGELPRVSVCSKLGDDKSRSLDNGEVLSSDDEEVATTTQKSSKSVLGGVFKFIKSDKNNVSNSDASVIKSEGIYLDDLNPEALPPEVASLYFAKEYRSDANIRKAAREDDNESGNGPSLPHSPHNLDAFSSGAQSIDSGDSDQERISYCGNCDINTITKLPYYDLSMSICGGLEELMKDNTNCERFVQGIVSFDDFVKNPSAYFQNPDLVIRMCGKYYNWQTVAPMIMSLLLFQREMPEKNKNDLFNLYMPKQKQPLQQVKSSWWYWRRNTMPASSASDRNVITPSPVDDPSHATNSSSTSTLVSDEKKQSVKNGQTVIDVDEDTSYLSSGSDNEERKAFVPRHRKKSVHNKNRKSSWYREKNYKKSLRLSTEQLANLNLKYGANEVAFSVTTAIQGTTRCTCQIYLWRYDDKIVISDIDGTITKSDVLGHLFPIIGKDWAHFGIASLFTKFERNGYKMMYLSARAIGQANSTREYLKSVRQDDVMLPDGPVLLSPTSLISAFHREVIEKKPEKFKISCLKDIQALFPSNPFYAGFGNKINDTWAYREVGIPVARIFTINYRGELRMDMLQTYKSSYTILTDVVDQMFPSQKKEESYVSEYGNFEYWREPIPSAPVDEINTLSINK